MEWRGKMASECPIGDCKDHIEGKLKESEKEIKEVIDDVVNVRLSVEKKVGRWGLITTTIAILSIVAGFVIYGFSAWGGMYKEVNKNTTSTEVITAKLSIIERQQQLIISNQINPEKLVERIIDGLKGNADEYPNSGS